jgi:hypothetical protein
MAMSRRAPPVVAVASLLCVGVAAAGTVRPGIALDHRIGPASVGEPRAQIEKDSGRGVAVRLDGKSLWFYRKVGIYVSYAPGPVTRLNQVAFSIVTQSARYKTGSGVGVGSSLQKLRRGVRVRCDFGNAIVCRHEGPNTNLPFTVFDVDHTTRRVTAVAIVPGGD